jgi:hypothetical protein
VSRGPRSRRGTGSVGLALATAILGLVGTSGSASAAPIAEPTLVRRHQLGLGLHASPTLGLELSYGARVPLRWRSALTPRVALGAPLANVGDGRSWDASVGADWFVPVWRELGVTTGASAWLGSARTVRADMAALGVELRVLPGWYAPRWALALAVAYRPSIATHVTHRAAAKADYGDDRYPTGTPASERFDGPRDGWYRGTAHTMMVGLEAGGVIRRRVGLYGGLGFLAQAGAGIVAFADVAQLPFYARTGVAVWF